ncbi:MAG: hypothetical protein DMG58_23610 [Acidobacteria bacterium]|nr:MAG: hypothetical protein DMG58_23610 [Acidobacteriota bacterium]
MKNNARMKTTGDIIVDALIKMGKPLTVKNWVSLNYWDRTLEDLEGEELAAVPFDMLVDTDSDEFVN